MLQKFINIYYNAQIKLKFINIYYNEQIKLTSRIIRLRTPRPKDDGHSRPSNLYSQKKQRKKKKSLWNRQTLWNRAERTPFTEHRHHSSKSVAVYPYVTKSRKKSGADAVKTKKRKNAT